MIDTHAHIQDKLYELSVEEINSLSHEELYNIVCKELKVCDSDLNQTYKSKKRAEYLERQFFVCPQCGQMQTVYSKGNYVYCSNCDLKVEYTENLLLKSENDNFKFEKLVDWYQYQLDYVKNLQVKEGLIFEDNDVEIYYSNTNQPRTLITKGKLKLFNDYLMINDYKIDVKDIIAASPVGGYKLMLSTDSNNYLFKGQERFNPVKYALILNVLDGPIKEKGGDKYYGFSIY